MLKRIEKIDKETILVEFSQPMEIVSTVPAIDTSGSFANVVEGLVFHTVSRDFDHRDLLSFYREVLKSVGLKRGVVFLTAVPMDKLRHEVLDDKVHIFATIGLHPPACIEMSKLFNTYLTASTINIAIAVNFSLTLSAMADLLRVVSEAKAVAASDSLLRCASRACGTVTDAIAILKPIDAGSQVLFVGVSTELGNKVAKAIHKMIISEAMAREASSVLKDVVGYGVEELLDLFLKVYRLSPIPGVSEDVVLKKAEELLTQFLKDPNVWSFLVAARELDLHGLSGTIAGLLREEFEGDSKKIIADELLGLTLASYLGGAKAIFSMYWIERLKERRSVEHWKSHMFEDDVISALIASLLTRVLDVYST